MPLLSKGPFRAKEKPLIILALITFTFVSFAAIFFLPSENRVNFGKDNKVYKVYKELRDAGQEFIIPPPPIESRDNPNIRHGVIDRPDPHLEEDKARLLAQIEMDREINEAKRQNQQVLQRPNMSPKVQPPSKSSSAIPLNPDIKKEGGKSLSVDVQGGADNDFDARTKRDTVKAMMKHAWEGYARYAWGKNEVRPISLRGHSTSIFGSTGMGATIVDAIDTLYIMGMMDEYKAARDWIEKNLDLNQMSGDISVFETNIRYLGGLLSIYSLSGDEMFKEKAVHVADKLLPAFNSPTGIPYSLVNMRTGLAKNFGWASGGSSILAEFGTLHMEFAYLSDITGNPVYKEKVDRVREVLKSVSRPNKLYPNYLNPKTGKWGQAHTSMGALGDSFYEYLLKEWLRTNKEDVQAKEMFDEAALDIEEKLVKKSKGGLTYFAEQKFGRLEHKMDHLACFGGGMYGLAAYEEKDSNSERWMKIAEGITNTCHESYDRTATKLGPEAFRFTDSAEAVSTKSNERYYILRPETFESYFVLWRITHDQKYRDWGWQAIEALEKHCKAEGGYTGIKNVYDVNSVKDDVQQSFFLAETLKYLYLLFSDDSLISIDQWVFNSEAHPLPRRDVNPLFRGGKSGLRPDRP